MPFAVLVLYHTGLGILIGFRIPQLTGLPDAEGLGMGRRRNNGIRVDTVAFTAHLPRLE